MPNATGCDVRENVSEQLHVFRDLRPKFQTECYGAVVIGGRELSERIGQHYPFVGSKEIGVEDGEVPYSVPDPSHTIGIAACSDLAS